MSTKQVTIAGTTGSISVEVKDGSTVRDVLQEAADTLGLDLTAAALEQLVPVVDSRPAAMDDVVDPTAQRVTAAPRPTNG